METGEDEAGILFGNLDSTPQLGTGPPLGNLLVVSYEKVVEHRKVWDSPQQ